MHTACVCVCECVCVCCLATVPTCVRGGGHDDGGAVLRHAQLPRSLGVQRGDGRGPRPPVPPAPPPRELEVQGLVQGQHRCGPRTLTCSGKSEKGRS